MGRTPAETPRGKENTNQSSKKSNQPTSTKDDVSVPYTIVYIGVHWCTMVYNGVPWCTMVYLGLQWCTLVYNERLSCMRVVFCCLVDHLNHFMSLSRLLKTCRLYAKCLCIWVKRYMIHHIPFYLHWGYQALI